METHLQLDLTYVWDLVSQADPHVELHLSDERGTELDLDDGDVGRHPVHAEVVDLLLQDVWSGLVGGQLDQVPEIKEFFAPWNFITICLASV